MMIFNSIRFRVGIASLAAIAIALLLANFVIGNLFKEHATRQFESTLQSYFFQVASLAERNQHTGELVFAPSMTEPRWSTPLSGLYWQANLTDGRTIRSRSLWDSTLKTQRLNEPGKAYFYSINLEHGQQLLALSKQIELGGVDATPFLLTIAADTAELDQSIRQFQSQIQWYLVILAIALLGIVVLQITIGLSPLGKLKTAIFRLRTGDTATIEGQFPSEFSPLVNDFNSVIEQNHQLVIKARTQAGNLAHAIKTPLTVITNALESKTISDADFRQLALEQTTLAKEQVDWSLARAKIITRTRNITLKTPVISAVQSIVRVMEKVYADKSLVIAVDMPAPSIQFNGEERDLHEIVGNLIDNACKWARKQVLISANAQKQWFSISIGDDGPGIHADQHAHVMQRGARLDELTPGSGLGLAIADDLVTIYGGNIRMDQSPLGGLKVTVTLPRSD